MPQSAAAARVVGKRQASLPRTPCWPYLGSRYLGSRCSGGDHPPVGRTCLRPDDGSGRRTASWVRFTARRLATPGPPLIRVRRPRLEGGRARREHSVLRRPHHQAPGCSEDVEDAAADVIDTVDAALTPGEFTALNARSVDEQAPAAAIAADWLAQQDLS